MEVSEDLLEEGKALLSDAVERERGGFPDNEPILPRGAQ